MIYKNIKAYCRKNSLSISAFERMCGIGNGVIDDWKDNKSIPRYETLQKICNTTKLPISYWTEEQEDGD